MKRALAILAVLAISLAGCAGMMTDFTPGAPVYYGPPHTNVG